MSFLPWFVITLLIGLTALYVAAEFAAFAVPRSTLARMAREGHRHAGGLLAVLEDGKLLDKHIAACQIGITLSGLTGGAYAQATIAQDLAPAVADVFALQPFPAQSIAGGVVLLSLTAAQVVLGELVPKTVALQFPERTALLTYLPLRWSTSLYRGFIWLLNGSGILVLKPFGIAPGRHQHIHSPEEIELLFAESRRGGALSPEAHSRLSRGLRLSTLSVGQLMVPRGEMVAIEATTSSAEILQRIMASSYSRLPVYEGSIDNMLGTINTKDVVGMYAISGEIPPLQRLLRPIPFVPQSASAHRLVTFLREQRSSKAIVVDEYGGVEGIVSIEDVLDALFGEIGDELKRHEPGVEPMADGRVRLSGSIPPDRAESWLGSRLESQAATLSGHIVGTLGRLPEVGETVDLNGTAVTVLEMSPGAIRAVAVKARTPQEQS
jgi:CBS domain containing-hemolysin-like protein